MIKLKDLTIGELAAYLCEFLNKNGIDCVLTGGACVSIYTKNKYMSNDIDFIDRTDSPRKKIKELLLQIGFSEQNRYFVHPDTSFFIEFPAGPLTVGNETVKEVKEVQFKTGKLFLLTPTDCVKDRLAAFYFWNDIPSLDQAIMVSKNHDVDLTEIKRWSKAEGQEEKFKIFRKKIKG